jgi:transposase
MQGKEPSEQDTKAESTAGIDVSKSWLDVHVLPVGAAARFANTDDGIRELKRWLKRFQLQLVAVEATGKWHRRLYRSLYLAKIPVTVVDPFRVRMFAKASGIFAKTDRLDARVLAQFAKIMTPRVRAPAPKALEELNEIVVARQNAVAEATALKNQLAAATSAFLQRQLKRRIERIAKDIATLDREIDNRIKADEGLARRYDILTSIAGFGPVVTTTLIAALAELGTCSRKQIGMLAGLAPITDQSGKREGVRVIWGGRANVRRILYLAALTAARHNPDMKAFFKRLIDNGKPPKLAIIAVARKLVILANILIHENRLWQPLPPKTALT